MNYAKNTVIAVIGTTGVGKSKLGIELAKAINGEIINSDSLQVYKGYDIITNKVSQKEMEEVPHHLLGFLEPSVQYTVQDFEADSTKKIKQIAEAAKVPILVGGTNYYTQSVLFNKALVTKQSREEDDKLDYIKDDKYLNYTKKAGQRVLHQDNEIKKLEDCTNGEIIELLRSVDPVMANVWHPNDRRRAVRSLEVYYETGKPHSEWIKESQNPKEPSNQTRYPSCIFWLYSKPDTLNRRISERVDKMIKEGLFEEVESFSKFMDSRAEVGKSKLAFDFGITQAIGFREFEQYWKELEKNGQSDRVDELKNQGIEEMKRNTCKYAKKQVSWIKNKFLPMIKEAEESESKMHLYVLDATDLDAWDTNVRDKAIDITKKFLLNEPLPDMASVSEYAGEIWTNIKKRKRLDDLAKIKCDICSRDSTSSRDGVARDVYLTGEVEYKKHLRSKHHLKNVKYLKTMEELAKKGIVIKKK